MFTNLAQLLQPRPSTTGPAVLAEREAFNKHLAHDAKEVATRLMASANTELKQVIDEIVQQAGEFYNAQLRRAEDVHKAEVAALRAEAAEVSKQLDDTVKMYNSVVQNLNSQLAEAHESLDATRRMAETKLQAAAAAIQHSHSVDQSSGGAAKGDSKGVDSPNIKQQLQEVTRQLASAQSALRDSDLKAQQKRLILVQTVEKQHQEMEDLRKQLKRAQDRDSKLTQVSEHLLSKQAALVQHIRSLESQLVALKGGIPPPAPSPGLSPQMSQLPPGSPRAHSAAGVLTTSHGGSVGGSQGTTPPTALTASPRSPKAVSGLVTSSQAGSRGVAGEEEGAAGSTLGPSSLDQLQQPVHGPGTHAADPVIAPDGGQ